jgi:glutamate/tyrosine decarboxylase-like PLP-dependent enzyme
MASNARNPVDLRALLDDAVGFGERFRARWDGHPPAAAGQVDGGRLAAAWAEYTKRLQDNYPYFHPRYAGQMLKPPHPVAVAGYLAAMTINPNNHALDGGPATGAMEKEVVGDLAAMFHLPADTLGHLTSSGTIANLEALWVARQLHPGMAVAYGEDAHYTHARMCEVLGVEHVPVPADAAGRMDLDALEELLRGGRVGTVVLTAGTTGTGAVDPIDDALALRERYGCRLHVDAAYGGFFTLLAWDDADPGPLDPATAARLRAAGACDSVVVDPHKHGLQPYGCGCVVFRDPAVGRHYRHDSPYTYFSSNELHLGEISLECSRPGAAAVALWATQKLFPLVRGGEFAKRLSECRAAALGLHDFVASDDRFIPVSEPELDIVVWAARAGSTAESSARAREIFAKAAKAGLHLALAELPVEFFGSPWAGGGTVTALRSVLMKPEHLREIRQIQGLLGQSAA